MPSSKKMKKNGYQYKREDLTTAIIRDYDADKRICIGRKYHNVKSDYYSRTRFESFALKHFPAALKVTYYGGLSRLPVHETVFKHRTDDPPVVENVQRREFTTKHKFIPNEETFWHLITDQFLL